MRAVLPSTNTQKALAFLCRDPGRRFAAVEIQKQTGISKPGANVALRSLLANRLAGREKKANLFLYFVDPHNAIIRQFKVLLTVMRLQRMVRTLAPHAERIVLFGSCSRGEDSANSDIDLFVLTSEPEYCGRAQASAAAPRNLQMITKTPVQYASMEIRDPTFFGQIARGVVLWERSA